MPASHTVYTISPSPDSTLAVEIKKTGLVKRKHLFVFERYSGSLNYDPDVPLASVFNLDVEADSILCRDSTQKSATGQRLTRFAREEVLHSKSHPELTIRSQRFTAKPLRGFVGEGTLCFGGIERSFKANIGFGVLKKDRLQIDADAALRLSDLGLPRPSSFLGLIQTQDEIVLHALVWGIVSVNP